MKDFESWQKEQEGNRRILLWWIISCGLLGTVFFIFTWFVMGWIVIIFTVLCLLARMGTDTDKNAYQKELDKNKSKNESLGEHNLDANQKNDEAVKSINEIVNLSDYWSKLSKAKRDNILDQEQKIIGNIDKYLE